MRNKRLLREYNEIQVIQLKNSPRLQGGFTFGCFKSTDKMTKKDGKDAVYRLATKPENKANPHVFFYEDGRKEFRNEQDKVVKETTWYCQELEKKTDPMQTPGMSDAVEQLKAYSNYKLYSEVSGKDTALYKAVNLKDPKNLPSGLPPLVADQFSKGVDFYMLEPLGLKQKQEDKNAQGQACIKYYTSPEGGGWKDEAKPQYGAYETIDLSQKCKNGGFQGEYILWRSVEGIGASEITNKLAGWIQSPEMTTDPKSWCRNGITLYYQAYSKKTQIGPEIITNYKNKIADCIDQGFKYPLLNKEIEQLKYAPPITLPTGQKMRYGIYDTQNENFERKLKNIIRENLNVISDRKKKSLIQEQKIVRNRFKFLLENTNLNTRKGQRILAKQLFVETAYLHTQGFDKKIINEGFWDMLKGLFGDSVDGALQYFKEYAAKWLLDQFGVDSSGWIGSIVITAIGNLDLADIPKLTDCNFVTKLLSKSLAEGAIRKLQGDTVGLGPVQDIIRNTLVEVLSETDLGDKIESALGTFICPMISKIAGKMGMAGETLKSNAMGATGSEGGDPMSKSKNAMRDAINKFLPGGLTTPKMA